MRAFVVAALMLGAAATADAQTRRFEAGASIGYIDFRDTLDEKPLCGALRAGYRITPLAAIEAEYQDCFEDPSGNFGQRLLLAGPGLSIGKGPVAVFGSARAGVMRMGGRAFRARNGVRTEPALHLGAGLEFALTPRLIARIEGGRTIVAFGESAGGTRANPAGSAGLACRF